MITVSVGSDYERYMLYDVIAMCGGFDEQQQQLYVESAERGDSSPQLLLECPVASSIQLIIYVVPRELPGSKNSEIKDFPPFEMQISVSSGGKEIYNNIHLVNAWGGTVEKLNLQL